MLRRKWSVLKKFCVETLNYKKCSLWNSEISHWEKKTDERRANANIDTNYELFLVNGARNN